MRSYPPSQNGTFGLDAIEANPPHHPTLPLAMNDRPPVAALAGQLKLERAVCSGCGCFCDDIALRYEDDQLVTIDRACPAGEAWLGQSRSLEPSAMIRGKQVELGRAIDEAVRLMRASEAPVIEGLTNLTLEAAREAVLLARDLSAAVVPRPLPASSFLRAGWEAPEFTATLGKVRTTADLIIFWRADPQTTHPRHLERYSYVPALLKEGARTLVVVDDLMSSKVHLTAKEATHCLELTSGAPSFSEDLELIVTLELLLRSKSVSHLGGESQKRTLEKATRLAGLIGDAKHTHVFVGVEVSESPAVCDALHGLAARVRAEHHVSVSSLPSSGNIWGVQELATWLLGAPIPLSLSSDEQGDASVWKCLSPNHSLSPDSIDLRVRLGCEMPGEVAGSDTSSVSVPRITFATQLDPAAAVSFAVPGLDPRLNGTVMRNDGITLTLCGDATLGVEDPTASILQQLRSRVCSAAEAGA